MASALHVHNVTVMNPS